MPLIAFVITLGTSIPTGRAEAATCAVPNQITNGQVADATVVMGNFNTLKDCVNAVVQPSGTPTAGNLSVFTGPNSISAGDVSGDCATAGTLSVTCTKTNGVPYGYFATGTDAGHLTGTASVNLFSNGLNADNTHFLRGDGVWATPPSGGGGTGTTTSATPSIRATSMASFNASSVAIPWPAGTVAGDVVIIFVSDGYSVNSPSGWTILNTTGNNDWANGVTAAKVITAADITAGSVTVTLYGAYNGIAAAVTIDGSTLNKVRAVAAARNAGGASASSAPLTGLFDAMDTDLVIGFTYIRGAMNPSISNFSQLQMVNAANASAYLGKFTSTFGKLGIGETATYPTSNNGFYWSVVALR